MNRNFKYRPLETFGARIAPGTLNALLYIYIKNEIFRPVKYYIAENVCKKNVKRLHIACVLTITILTTTGKLCSCAKSKKSGFLNLCIRLIYFILFCYFMRVFHCVNEGIFDNRQRTFLITTEVKYNTKLQLIDGGDNFLLITFVFQKITLLLCRCLLRFFYDRAYAETDDCN
jgi:hypothetical protein